MRARREFTNQSSLGFMATATNRNLDEATRFLPGQAYTGGIDCDWRLGPKYAIQGYLAGSSVQRRRGGDRRRCSADNVHSFQRPDSDHARLRSHAHVAERLRRVGSLQQDRRRSGSGSPATSASRVPGFEINDVGFMQRADQRTMSNWMQVRYEKPSKYLRSFRYNLNQWAGWNYGRRSAAVGRQRQRARGVHEQLGYRHGREPSTRSRSTIARRAAVPASTAIRSRRSGATSSSDERPAVAGQRLRFGGGDGRGIDVHGDQPLGLRTARRLF